jgi:predicted Zn-dependent protease
MTIEISDEALIMSEAEAAVSMNKAQAAVAGLAAIYLKHNDAARAIVLSLLAMKLGPPEPYLALIAASAFLRTQEPEQALAVLSRFENSAEKLSREPSPLEVAAYELLLAKASYTLGDTTRSVTWLDRARKFWSEFQ